VAPGSYDATAAHYPRVCNAAQHPTVAQFMALPRAALVARYCALHPEVREAELAAVLRRAPAHFRWAGCDLFVVSGGPAGRRTVVVETNSCPSGQKSLPFADGDELNGYGRLMRCAFKPLLQPQPQAQDGGGGGGGGGVLAVIYDKNNMEASGYAAALAELTGETVYLAEHFLTDPSPPLYWDAAQHLHVRVAGASRAPSPAAGGAAAGAGAEVEAESGGAFVPAPAPEWLPVRAALRYVTQKPWTRMPVTPATRLLNPLLPCLAGGRNKMLAARAYDALNARLAAAGGALRLRTPATVGDVRRAQVPALVRRMGGLCVVKVPYGNAGQGVYTITSPAELEEFMREPQAYDKFVVQQLVGGRRWAEDGAGAAAGAGAGADAGAGAEAEAEGGAPPLLPPFERAYHLGTVPNARGKTFVFDLRMMVMADEDGFRPCSMYARRAAAPLSEFAPGSAAAAAAATAAAEAAAAAAAAAVAATAGAGRGARRSPSSSVSSVESAAAAGYSLAPPSPPAGPGAPGGAKALSASWLQLGTNLSVLTGDLTWSTESERLVMMDARDFSSLGLGLDDLIDAFVQSCLAVLAIDDQAAALLDADGAFSLAKFAAVNDDPALLAELVAAQKQQQQQASAPAPAPASPPLLRAEPLVARV